MRARALWTVLITIAAGSAGCGVTEPQQASGSWNVSISGLGSFPDLTGTAGVASQFGATTAAIRVAGYRDVTFSWRLHSGTCLTPGSGIGVEDRYPALVLGSMGSAEVSAGINQMLDRNGEFALIVRSTDGAIAGCGDLIPFRP